MGTGDSYIRSCAVWKRAAWAAFFLVNIVNHSGLLSALKRGETTADTLISESIYFLSLSRVIYLAAGARMVLPSSCLTPLLCRRKHDTASKILWNEHKVWNSGYSQDPPLCIKLCDSSRSRTNTHFVELEASLPLNKGQTLQMFVHWWLNSSHLEIASRCCYYF